MRFRRLCTDAVQIEYLVAYKRVVHYCKDCDAEAGSRAVTKGTNNKGRKILVCSESCGWTMMLPQCYCNRHAEVAFAKTGKSYYRCGSKRGAGRCDFKDWDGPAEAPGGLGGSPCKKQRAY